MAILSHGYFFNHFSADTNDFFCRKEDILAPESGHCRKVFALKFHPFDDNIFLTGGWDRCVKVQINVPLVKS